MTKIDFPQPGDEDFETWAAGANPTMIVGGQYEAHIEAALEILGWQGLPWTYDNMIRALVAKIERLQAKRR